jgi:hypothetical protein
MKTLGERIKEFASLTEEQILRTLLAKADAAPAGSKIILTCLAIADMLLEKNAAYGNSALEPMRVFSKAPIGEQILVRLDDKLSRLQRGHAAGEDVIGDLLGYLVLLMTLRFEQSKTAAKVTIEEAIARAGSLRPLKGQPGFFEEVGTGRIVKLAEGGSAVITEGDAARSVGGFVAICGTRPLGPSVGGSVQILRTKPLDPEPCAPQKWDTTKLDNDFLPSAGRCQDCNKTLPADDAERVICEACAKTKGFGRGGNGTPNERTSETVLR